MRFGILTVLAGCLATPIFSQIVPAGSSEAASIPLPPRFSRDRSFAEWERSEAKLREPVQVEEARETSDNTTVPKTKDWVDRYYVGAKWFRRGAAVVDGVSTYRMLDTPEYRPGYLYRARNPFGYVYFGRQHEWLPREGGWGKYVAGDRSKAGVLTYMTAVQLTFEFGTDKLYGYLSRQKDWRRKLRVAVPVLHTWLGIHQVRLAVNNERIRAHYLEELDWMGLPNGHVPRGIPVPEPFRSLWNEVIEGVPGGCCLYTNFTHSPELFFSLNNTSPNWARFSSFGQPPSPRYLFSVRW